MNPRRHRTRSWKSLPACLAIAAALAAVPQSAAYCGLEHCPVGYRPEGQSQLRKWAAGLSWRMVTFEQNGKEIGFQQGTARLEWRPIPRLVLGGDLPVAVPITASDYAYGFSNPLVFAEAALFSGIGSGTGADKGSTQGAHLSIGTQVELPYGDVSKGFASDHVMAVPYAVLGGSAGAFSLSIRLGWTAAIANHAHAAAAPSSYDTPMGSPVRSARTAHVGHSHADKNTFIEPHSNRDVLMRIEGSRTFRVGTAALDLNGAHAREAAFRPRNALSCGASFEVPLGERVSIRPEVRFPLTRPARFQTAGGVGIRKAF